MPEVGPGAVRSAHSRGRVLCLLWRPVRLVLIAYLVLILMVSWLQTLLIFPGQSSRGQPHAQVEPGPGTELVMLRTADGDRIAALFGKALDASGRPLTDAASRPTILFFYGNGSNLKDSLDLFASFRRLGANVMVPEYVGYGMSEGRAGEAGCYATAEAAYQALLARSDVDPDRIVAAGWSLGGAVAIDLASRHEVAGLIVFSTFTRMADMARLHYPWLPASWLLRHHFENLEKIAGITAPILIGHGALDELIPPAMSDHLAAEAGGPTTQIDLPNSGHADIFLLDGPRLFAAMRSFLASIPAPDGP